MHNGTKYIFKNLLLSNIILVRNDKDLLMFPLSNIYLTIYSFKYYIMPYFTHTQKKKKIQSSVQLKPIETAQSLENLEIAAQFLIMGCAPWMTIQ